MCSCPVSRHGRACITSKAVHEDHTSLEEDKDAAWLQHPCHVCSEGVDAFWLAAQLVKRVESDHRIDAGVRLCTTYPIKTEFGIYRPQVLADPIEAYAEGPQRAWPPQQRRRGC